MVFPCFSINFYAKIFLVAFTVLFNVSSCAKQSTKEYCNNYCTKLRDGTLPVIKKDYWSAYNCLNYEGQAWLDYCNPQRALCNCTSPEHLHVFPLSTNITLETVSDTSVSTVANSNQFLSTGVLIAIIAFSGSLIISIIGISYCRHNFLKRGRTGVVISEPLPAHTPGHKYLDANISHSDSTTPLQGALMEDDPPPPYDFV